MKGLSFTAPMMLAWLDGRKTVTRRLVKLPSDFSPTYAADANMETPPVWFDFVDEHGTPKRIKAKYIPGETVYIKEVWVEGDVRENQNGSWAVFVIYRETNDRRPDGISCEKFGSGLWKRCDGMKAEELARNIERMEVFGDKWRSPRFMPEWASRSHARIVSVRPERVQEITEEEAIKEGAILHYFGNDNWGNPNPGWAMYPIDTWTKGLGSARFAFANLWESLHPGSWDRNDWVWRIELENLNERKP